MFKFSQYCQGNQIVYSKTDNSICSLTTKIQLQFKTLTVSFPLSKRNINVRQIRRNKSEDFQNLSRKTTNTSSKTLHVGSQDLKSTGVADTLIYLSPLTYTTHTFLKFFLSASLRLLKERHFFTELFTRHRRFQNA